MIEEHEVFILRTSIPNSEKVHEPESVQTNKNQKKDEHESTIKYNKDTSNKSYATIASKQSSDKSTEKPKAGEGKKSQPHSDRKM